MATATMTLEQFRAESRRPHTLKAGDVVYNSWGWEQTNIDFYEVVRTSARFVWLRKLAATREETGFMCGPTSPILGQYASETREKHIVSMYGGEPSVKFEYSSGKPWNGQPKQCSWYA